MATTVYLPPDYGGVSPGYAVGQGLGAYAGFELSQMRKRQKVAEMQQYIEAIKQAPDRRSALEIGSKLPFEDTKDISSFYKLVDEFHPERVDPVEAVDVYDEKTGTTTKRFLPKSKLPLLNDAGVVKSLFGDNSTLSKVDRQDYYSPEGKHLGKLPEAQRPEGALTLRELDLQRRAATDERANRALDVTLKRLDLSEQAARRAEVGQAEQFRMNDVRERLMESLISRNNQLGRQLSNTEKRQQLANVKTVTNLVTNSLNVKRITGKDGEITLDFSGAGAERDRQKYVRMLQLIPNAIEAYPQAPTQAAAAIIEQTNKEFPVEVAPADIAPVPQKGGGVSGMIRGLFGSDTSKAKEKLGSAPKTPAKKERKVVRTGTLNGKKVVQYDDGSVEYAK